MSDAKLLMALANLVLCSIAAWTCVCRISVMAGETTRKLNRAAYSVMLMAICASGWAPWLFGEWPGWADLLMSTAVIVYMTSGMRAWKFGVPTFARSGPAPLELVSEQRHDRRIRQMPVSVDRRRWQQSHEGEAR